MRYIVALAGGVGGSRFARGLRAARPDADLTVVVNTGDDVTLHGLRISPDVDTVLYALSGLVDEKRGWGPRGVAAGWPPSRVTAELAERLGIIGVHILPMTDAPVETWVELRDEQRWVHFQDYFVRRRTDVAIGAVSVRGLEQAQPAPGVIEALEAADLIVLCPSNPFVSIGPILSVRGVRQSIEAARARGVPVAAISPLIGGVTIKGPAARMLTELGFQATAAGVLEVYDGLVDVYLIDEREVLRETLFIRIRGLRPLGPVAAPLRCALPPAPTPAYVLAAPLGLEFVLFRLPRDCPLAQPVPLAYRRSFRSD